MTSREKILDFIDQASHMSDRELSEAIPLPIPPYALRGVLATFAGQLPQDSQELDEWLEGVSGFCLSMRSDHAAEAA